MSIYRKDEQGILHKSGGSVIQRWNDRIFLTNHSVVPIEDYQVDYYDLEPSASKYIVSFTNYTEYQLYFSETNESGMVYIRFKGQTLLLKRSTGDPVLPHSLLGKVHGYTLDISTGEIWTDATINIQLMQSDISDLKTKTTAIYTYKGSVAFENLPISNNEVGDTYNITNDFIFGGHNYLAGTNIAWTGLVWDPLASKIPNSSKIPYSGRVIGAEDVKTAIDQLQGEIILNTTTTNINHTLLDGQDVTYSATLNSIQIVIPLVSHGYYAGINFKTSANQLSINITNNSGKPLLIIDGGVTVPNVIFSPNKTYNLAFYCDGLNVYCYYIYIGA